MEYIVNLVIFRSSETKIFLCFSEKKSIYMKVKYTKIMYIYRFGKFFIKFAETIINKE